MKIVNTLAAFVILSFSSLSQANLIDNGGFENSTTSSWEHKSDADWNGDHIEVWKSNFLGVKSHSGGFHGELNSHGDNGAGSTGGTAFSIYQIFDTIVNQLYSVTFAYRARTKNGEEFNFRVYDGGAGGNLLNTNIINNETDEWTVYNNTFVGTGNPTTLKFTSITPRSGTVGNFIDSVSVTVAEPGSIILLSLGLLGLGASRKLSRG